MLNFIPTVRQWLLLVEYAHGCINMVPPAFVHFLLWSNLPVEKSLGIEGKVEGRIRKKGMRQSLGGSLNFCLEEVV